MFNYLHFTKKQKILNYDELLLYVYNVPHTCEICLFGSTHRFMNSS